MKALSLACIASAIAALAFADSVNFDKDQIGKPPAGWTATQTGRGAAKWTVVEEDSAKALKQSGVATFPICIRDDANLKDGFVEVKFKPIAGKEDQAGGVLFRVKDADNYYVARANALEDNVTIYHTVKGSRVAFKNVDTKVAPNQWHSLRVDFAGNTFTVTFDGRNVITATDDTFKDAGKVGLWTKADSVTLFKDFSYGDK